MNSFEQIIEMAAIITRFQIIWLLKYIERGTMGTRGQIAFYKFRVFRQQNTFFNNY